MKKRITFVLVLGMMIICSTSDIQAVQSNAINYKNIQLEQENLTENPKSDSVISQDSKKTKSRKEIEVAGKKTNVTYKESKKAIGIQKKDRDVYRSENGEIAEFDQETGDLLYYSVENYMCNGTENIISEQEALSVANEFIQKQCDISQYTLVDISFNELSGYLISYSKYLLGYKTTEVICLRVSATGEIETFIYNPYVFENIDTENITIDENNLKAQLAKTIKEQFGDTLTSYNIVDMRMKTNEEDSLCMEFFVDIEYDKNSKGNVINLVYEVLL